MTDTAEDSKAEARHLIDIHVGKQLVALRHAAGQNQSEIAAVLGLSFQQVQKYERGANRISASVLFTLAEHFEVPVSRFFEGFDTATGETSPGAAISATRHGQKLWMLFSQMTETQQRTLLATAQAFVPANAHQQAAA